MGFMERLLAFALKYRAPMVVFLASMLVVGYVSFRNLNIEAYPDPVPPQIEIVTQATGISSEEIERDFTIPIEASLAGIPHVADIHSVSQFGLSDIHVQFTYDFSYEEALQRVLNNLSQLGPLAYGALPNISPESPIGEIYRYRVVGPPGYSVTDLKTLQDWVLLRRFKAVPGVVDVAGWGGKTKAYEVDVDQNKMNAAGISLAQILTVIGNSDINVGGQTIDIGPEGVAVRGVGLVRNLDDLGSTMVTSNSGVPILLSDIASVQVGHIPRLGIAGEDSEDDIVQGIVLMGRGEKTLPTLRGVEAEVAKINAGGILPPGVHLETIYDRTDLVNVTTDTVLHNLFFGIVLIFLIQWIFLGNLRSAIIVSLTIPFALSFAIMLLTIAGESANLLSIGAVDFGLVVDATVIMVENIFRRLALAPRAAPDQKLDILRDASQQVTRPIFFAALIIVTTFIPLFTLSGVEGHIFGPMAKTYAYAIAGGLIATFTVSPALSAILLRGNLSERDTFVVHWLRRAYRPVLQAALSNPILTLVGTVVLLAVAYFAGRQLGTEFLPHLEEGNFWIRATMPQSISLEAGTADVRAMRKLMLSHPEVVTVISQHGRPDDGTDTGGFYNTEFFVPLKPFDTWPKGVDKASLTATMSDELTKRFPGVDFNFSQNIEDNVEEAASGVKGENSVKVYGGELKTLDKTADDVLNAMSDVKGIEDLAVFHAVRQPTIDIVVDRKKAARYGLMPGDVNLVVQTAIGGQAAANNLYEEGSDRNFPIIVRLAPQFRSGIEAIRKITVNAPNPSGSGTIPVPLDDVADVHFVTGASQIYRQSQERYVPVKYSVRGRDLGGAVLEAQARVAQKVRLPSGARLEWVGELAELNDALSRLEVAVPVSLLLVIILLYFNFGSMREALLAASVLPLALIGGILALYLTHTPVSVSATIGFIALFGISIMNGIIVVASYNGYLANHMARLPAIRKACEQQLRPVLMTCIAACVGLLPAALSNGIGSQVQKPLALVVVGGSLVAPFLILLVLPVLIRVIAPDPPLEPKSPEPSGDAGYAS
jgi:cobalt-zinc-cadmium resistance protein CzcA